MLWPPKAFEEATLWEIYDAHRACHDNMLIQRGIDPNKRRKSSPLKRQDVKDIREELLLIKEKEG